MSLPRIGLLLSTAVLLTTSPHIAGTAAADDEDDGFRRKTPSGQYIDPSSFFRFHGYVSLSYSQVGAELGPANGGTPNILVSGPGPSAVTGENEGGFRNDAALFVGGEPFEGVSAVIELHFVGDATDPVLTEAKMTWDVLGEEDGDVTFRVTGGRFWWPFGIHNGEWFSAVNRFSLLSPAATEVVPAHYNEVGIMGEGEVKLQDSMGLNYVFAIGNGVPGFGLMPNVRGTGADTNGNRTITGRAALVYHSGIDFELGVSFSTGELRAAAAADPALAGTAEALEASFSAFGPDLTIGIQGLALRSYYYTSTEDLTGAPDLDRTGFTLEPSYTIDRQGDRLKSITLLARYSVAEEDDMSGGTLTRSQFGIGLTANITKSFVAEVGFISQGEDDDLPDQDNNVFSISLTNEF